MEKKVEITETQIKKSVNNKYHEAFEQMKVFYMFMHEDDTHLHFKHILTRDYIKIKKEVLK
tara:strand:+ start:597 stop:779 length:183 start_codon:yes stop_codon:yes gene_type:complete